MAKAETSKNADDKKKKKKSAPGATVKIKVKAKKDKGAKAGDKTERKSRKADSLDGLAKLVDHPMVADLLAAGAMAAVAAIAEHQMAKSKGESSSKMVKSVGKAAATAMGRKLMGDIGAITTAATDAAKKA